MKEPQPHDSSQNWIIEPSDYRYITILVISILMGRVKVLPTHWDGFAQRVFWAIPHPWAHPMGFWIRSFYCSCALTVTDTGLSVFFHSEIQPRDEVCVICVLNCNKDIYKVGTYSACICNLYSVACSLDFVSMSFLKALNGLLCTVKKLLTHSCPFCYEFRFLLGVSTSAPKRHFSQLYCYSYWHDTVIRLSVCSASVIGIQGRCRGIESCTIVFLAGHLQFTSSDTFAVGCIICPQNAAIS